MKRFFVLLTLAVASYADGPLQYAPAPNDAYWLEEWHLENLGTNAIRTGVDINAREAWAYTRGAGINIAIVDNGVESTHPDLIANSAPELDFTFQLGVTNGLPLLDSWNHGTSVAGLAAATGNNGRGVIGVAPEARFASWVIFSTNTGTFVDSDALASMFQSHLDTVQVQNHSWVKVGDRFTFMSGPESNAIQRAVTEGRDGKGVIIIRAAGNDRTQGRNSNDDAYTADPRAVTVASVRFDGRAATYSNPGASILVSTPSGDTGGGFPNLFTTDRVGQKGFNQINFFNDLADYVFGAFGFGGTSASAPILSGISALMLSANPNLTYRDVQQILILAADQTDPADPDLQRNGAGFMVSHNTGFGMVNAGTAVDLARHWPNRPPATSASVTTSGELPIPDGSLRLLVSSSIPLPPGLDSIPAVPSLGIHVEEPTAIIPLIYVGDAATPLETNLTGKAALIQRGGATFADKIQNAANAGALFAVIYNNDSALAVGGTDFVPIPAIFIDKEAGEGLVSFSTNYPMQAQISLSPVHYDFQVDSSIQCEQVLLHVNFSEQARGDMRLTLVSPGGTRSVLQRFGLDVSPFDGAWTYMTTHHFYEPSRGKWQAFFSDEATGATGVVHSATLEITGVPLLLDTDNDALPDDWELANFLSLQYGPADDPDQDGYSNIREFVMGTNPGLNESPTALAISSWNSEIVRLNWNSRAGTEYQVLSSDDVTQPFTVLTNLPGEFPRTPFYIEAPSPHHFFKVREVPAP
jgi:subtilisin family serine protease/subtilisin-like proprotein convertase family protein